MSNTTTNTETINQLNALLRGELSAVETYDQVLKKLSGAETPTELPMNRDCHFRRTQLLANEVVAKGGTPESSSGTWGALAQAATGSAKLFGRDAMIAVLEEGEDRGLSDYRTAAGVDDEDVQQLINVELLPAQKRTHERMSLLKKRGAPKDNGATRSK
jgi:Domain of unknown function (DUF2383)